MQLLGIDEVTFGAKDLEKCRQFFLDWGLSLHTESAQELVFTSLNGCRVVVAHSCLLYTSPSPRDRQKSRMPSSA